MSPDPANRNLFSPHTLTSAFTRCKFSGVEVDMTHTATFKPLTRREQAGVANFIGRILDRIVRQNAKPNPHLAKPPVTRDESRFYTKADLFRRWLKRGERRRAEGELAGAILGLPRPYANALSEIRLSRERLDAMHGAVLDIAPRLRNLCWAIDAANAEPE